MANNYLTFSELITNLTAAEKEWWQDHACPQEFDNDAQMELWCDTWGDDEPQYWPGFEWSYDDAGLWLRGDEYGNVDNLAKLVQAFLKGFRPDDHFSLTWAETCSRGRVGQFGGGALWVTADKIEFLLPYRWIEERVLEKEGGMGGSLRVQDRNLWPDNHLQFPRLLSEVAGILTLKQHELLQCSMGLTAEQVDELFDRAEDEWERIKLLYCRPKKEDVGSFPHEIVKVEPQPFNVPETKSFQINFVRGEEDGDG